MLLNPIAYTDCGTPVFRLSFSGCENIFANVFFGKGKDTYPSGSVFPAFQFKQVFNLQGCIKRLPRVIERSVSEKCNVQRVQSSIPYQFECFEIFPEWKAKEIEDYLHSEKIYINDEEIVFDDDEAPFTLIRTHLKQGYYSFKFNFRLCNKIQNFGCSDCSFTDKWILIPTDNDIKDGISIDDSAFFNDSGVKIANDYSGFKDWLVTQNGVESVVYHTPVSLGLECNAKEVIEIKGDIDVSRIFIGSPSPQNQFNLVGLDRDSPDVQSLCNGRDKSCNAPTVGTIVIEDMTCDDPVVGTIEITDCCPAPVVGTIVIDNDFFCNCCVWPDGEW